MNPKAPSTEREHIFPASQLTPLAIQWKQLSAAGRHKEAMLVLEEIVKGSTAMFERLAQFENFHFTVDLPILVSAAQEKIPNWLLKWQPRRGRLFTYFSTCAKNAFRSELGKVNTFRKHYHVTSDNLERFYGVEDHDVDKHDAAAATEAKLKDMTCRWGDPQEIGAIRFLTRCIIEDDHNKHAAIRGAMYAYCISPEQAAFFYNWAVVNLRHAFYERVYVPFTDFELMLASESYTFLPDLNNIIGNEKTRAVLAVLGGRRVKFPTLQQLAVMRQNYLLAREIEKSDGDPETIAEIARKHKKTARSAQEIYTEMSEQTDSKRYGEHILFPDGTDT